MGIVLCVHVIHVFYSTEKWKNKQTFEIGKIMALFHQKKKIAF